VCLPAGNAFAWTFFTAQAVLFGERSEQLTTHFFSPNPEEGGTLRPTWQHSRDKSSVWVKFVAPSSDPACVAPDAFPWLLLEVAGAMPGPRGLGALTHLLDPAHRDRGWRSACHRMRSDRRRRQG
jgi:hypothetical protein